MSINPNLTLCIMSFPRAPPSMLNEGQSEAPGRSAPRGRILDPESRDKRYTVTVAQLTVEKKQRPSWKLGTYRQCMRLTLARLALLGRDLLTIRVLLKLNYV